MPEGHKQPRRNGRMKLQQLSVHPYQPGVGEFADRRMVREKLKRPELPKLDGLPLRVQAYLEELDTWLGSIENNQSSILMQVMGLHKAVIESRRLVNPKHIKQVVENIDRTEVERLTKLRDDAGKALRLLVDTGNITQEQLNEAVS